MLNTQSVNAAFTPVSERPVSHGAAVCVLGALAWIAHEGISAWVPGGLGAALTVLFLAVAVLQWLGLGRKEACEDARDDERAEDVIRQAWIFGGIETVLYAAGGLALLAKEHMDVYNWIGLLIATMAAAAAAYLNFRIKWTSCDPVKARRTVSNGGTRLPDVLFAQPTAPVAEEVEPADWSKDPTVVKFMNREQRLADLTKSEAEALAKAPTARPAPVRLRNAAKRIRIRAQRASEKEAIAA